MSSRAADWVARALEAIPGGSSTIFPRQSGNDVVACRGTGATVSSPDGRTWIDYLLGSGPLILGHAHPAVIEAAREQLKLGSTFYAVNPRAVELAEEVNRAVRCAEQTRFTSTGTEATMYALRIARAATGRELVVTLNGGYHGGHDYAVIGMAQPVGVPRAVQESVVVASFNSAQALDAALAEHEGQIAAVIMEPYQRGIPPAPGYLEAVRRATSDAGALLIFDEIVTGFRLAYGGAQAHYDVVPDLCTLGKILGGGFPLGAVCGPRELMRLAATDQRGSDDAIFWNGTFYGNPVAAAAGLATLEELRRPGVYERLFAVGERMRSGLARVTNRHDVSGQVVGDGPMFYLDLDKDLQRRIGAAMVRRGHLWLAENRSYLSTAHTDEQVDATIADVDDVVRTLVTEREQ